MRPGLGRRMSRTDFVPLHQPVQVSTVGKSGEYFKHFLQKHCKHQENNTYTPPKYHQSNNNQDGNSPARNFTDKHHTARILPINYDSGRHIEQYTGHNGRKRNQPGHKGRILNTKHKHREGKR